MDLKLTDGPEGTIASAEIPEEGQRFIFDNHPKAPKGFALRVTKAGGKAFVFSYKINGRMKRKTIGDWPTWSLIDARGQAIEMRLLVSRGIDPMTESQALIKTAYEYIENLEFTAENRLKNMMITEYNELLDAIGMAYEKCDNLLSRIKETS